MYEKLGGKAAIEAVVDLFYGKVFADEEVSRFFEGINKPRLKAHQVCLHMNRHESRNHNQHITHSATQQSLLKVFACSVALELGSEAYATAVANNCVQRQHLYCLYSMIPVLVAHPHAIIVQS